MPDVTYHLPHGLGTYFSEFERPLTFATAYYNRFRNINGGSERRPGLTSFPQVTGKPNLTRLHEFVSETGTETIFASDDNGNVYKYAASAWSTALSSKAQARLISVEADGKLIFCNGIDRNFYTDDAGSTFRELKALIVQGKLATGSSAQAVVDSDVSNWVNNVLVSNNDIVYNVTRNAYGVVSTIASAKLTTTTIGTAGTGAGYSSVDQQSGDTYELIDYVDLNIIKTDYGGYDNVGTATTGTTTTCVAVSGVDFSATEIRENDFVYNTTRSAISRIGTVSANANIKESITGQVSGDSLVFFKSAMPIASWIHVHYGRTYYVDARNKRRVVISAPDDPQDVTTYQKTLEATSFDFGSQSTAGDVIKSIGTFLSYLAVAGERNVYIYQGNNPIADSSSSATSFTPIAVFPNGAISPYALSTDGGNLVYITQDGLQAVGVGYNLYSLNQNNISTPIFSDFKAALAAAAETDIQISYYPRRKWHVCKLGDVCYVLNSNPSYDVTGAQQQLQSWHLYGGLWAQQNHYFVRRNGDLLACGAMGRVYYADDGAATDDGTAVSTIVETAWIRLEEPQKTPRIKEGHFIRPIFESNAGIQYTIEVVAGLDSYSSDSITVSAGGSGQIGSAIVGVTPIGGGSYAQANKYPLRWRGEQAKIKITSESSLQPDVITSFTLYGNISGKR